MDPDTIHRMLKATPFRPFRLFLSNGRTYDVRHPELALVGKRELLIGSPASGYADPTYDRVDTISLLHVNDIQQLPVPGSSGPVA